MTKLKKTPKSLKNQIDTFMHDFWVDPLHNLTIFLSYILVGILIAGFTLSVVETFF